MMMAAAFFSSEAMPQVDVPFSPFYVYKDKESEINHFFPTGWMGDCQAMTFEDDAIRDAKTFDTCIKILYRPSGVPDAPQWSGIYWQNPGNNWGSEEGSFDLTGAKRLSFLARGEKGGELVQKFQVGGISGDYSDSSYQAIYSVRLTKDWKQYIIELEKTDLSFISGGFCVIMTQRDNAGGAVIYIDEIRYE
jgi:hypothetical protein